jgi:hypothetical protein
VDRNRYHKRELPVIALAAVCTLLLAGCDTPEHAGGELPANDVAGERAMSSPVTAAPSTADPPAAASGLPAPGTFDIRLHRDKVTLLANDAPARDVLNSFASLAGFELLDAGIPMQRVTLTIEDSDVHSALVALLKSGPYQIIYEFDNAQGMDTLTRVVAGRMNARDETLPVPSLPECGCATGNLEGAPLPDAGRTSLSTQDQVYLSLLLDPSPDVRADAAESIEATGIALDYLARIITTDPSPEVRIAATYSLESSEDPRAVDTLIMGLNDTDPEVLVEVIDSLEYLDNRSAIPYLQPLLDHADEDVRNAAESAIESLQYF